jgi:hypothetical protein
LTWPAAIQYNKILYYKISADTDINTSIQLYLLLSHAALLYEGIDKFNKKKEDFKELAYYKANMDKIEIILTEANDPNSFTNNVLQNVRNRIAFHFDKGVIEQVIQKFVGDCMNEKIDVVLISEKSELVKDTTYLLADNMNIHFVLHLINNQDVSDDVKFRLLSEKLLDLSGLFCDILESLILDLIGKYCELKES